MLHISRVNLYHLPEHIYGVFIALACLCKVIAEQLLVTFYDLKSPGDMGRGHRSQYSDSGCYIYL